MDLELRRQGRLIVDQLIETCWPLLRDGDPYLEDLLERMDAGRQCLLQQLSSLKERDMRALQIDYLRLIGLRVTSIAANERFEYARVVATLIPDFDLHGFAPFLLTDVIPKYDVLEDITNAFYVVMAPAVAEKGSIELPENHMLVCREDLLAMLLALLYERVLDTYAMTLHVLPELAENLRVFLDTAVRVPPERLDQIASNWRSLAAQAL